MPALLPRSIALALAAALVPATAAARQGEPRELIERYARDLRDLERFYDLGESAPRLERLDRLAAETAAELQRIDYAALAPDDRVDWVLLRDALEAERRERAALREELVLDAPLLPGAAEIVQFELDRWKLTAPPAQEAAGRLADLARAVAELERSVVRAGGEAREGARALEPEVAVRVAARADKLRALLAGWLGHFRGFDPEYSWWIEQPGRALSDALASYSAHLRREVAGLRGERDDPLIGRPIGRDALVAGLARERIAYSPEELIAIAERQLEWCDARMREAARELGCGDDAGKALARVKSLHVAPGRQDDLVLAQANEAIRFLDERDLVTIPDLCRETWHVDMMSAERQRVLPYAVYDGQSMAVSFPTADMDHATKLMALRGNNEHFTRNVTPHELIPGHHLQGFLAERARSYRRPFSTPFLVEGWALYWEFRFLDLGWARGPEDRVGILFWRKHRAARIVVSLKFHLGQMATAEMIDFLVERVGHERDGATSEVRRYVAGDYGPLYQCAYMVGGLQLYALYRERVASGKQTERQFHDAVLGENAIPIDLIRARLAGLPLERDAAPTWRFADS